MSNDPRDAVVEAAAEALVRAIRTGHLQEARLAVAALVTLDAAPREAQDALADDGRTQ